MWHPPIPPHNPFERPVNPNQPPRQLRSPPLPPKARIKAHYEHSPFYCPPEGLSHEQRRLQEEIRQRQLNEIRAMEANQVIEQAAQETKRRLIKDARGLAKRYKISQRQMAEEMGIPRRTLEDWLQYRRMPQAAGTTLMQRWVEDYLAKET